MKKENNKLENFELLLNSRLTKPGKLYLRKHIDNFKIPVNMIPNYILRLFSEFSDDPVAFEAERTKPYFRKCKSLMRRYNLIESKRKNKNRARDNWNQYMRDYRMKRKSMTIVNKL